VVNAKGLIQTTNFIGSREVRLGVGRYFLDRMALGSKGSTRRYAGPRTHSAPLPSITCSRASRKALVAVEVTPSKKQIVPIEGLYLHTNHLVFDEMKDEKQDEKYVSTSSVARLAALEAWAKAWEPRPAHPRSAARTAHVAPGKAVQPVPPPEGEVAGATWPRPCTKRRQTRFGSPRTSPASTLYNVRNTAGTRLAVV